MTSSNHIAPESVERHAAPGLELITLAHKSHRELFITAPLGENDPWEAAFLRVADVIGYSGATVVSQEVLGAAGSEAAGREALAGVFDGPPWPVTWSGAFGSV